MQRIELAPGYEISRVIRGGWQLSQGHGQVKSDDAAGDMIAFADAGITTFDCADIYTGVEDMIGEFRQRYRMQRGDAALQWDPRAHQVRARPRHAAAHHQILCRGRHRPLLAAAEDGAARSRAVPLVGLCRAGLSRGGRPSGRPPARRQDRPDRRDEFRHGAHAGAGRQRRAAGFHAGAIFAARRPAGPADGRGGNRAWRLAALLRHGGGRVPERPLAGHARAGSRLREPLADQVQAGHRRFRRLGAVPETAEDAAAHRRQPRQRHRDGGQRRDAAAAGRRRRHRRRAQQLAPCLEPGDIEPGAQRRGSCRDRRGAGAWPAISKATCSSWSATATAATARS